MANAVLLDVPLDRLVATQRCVTTAWIRAGATRRPAPAHRDDYPLLLRSRGRYYIADGHHRAMSALLCGDRSLRARVIDRGDKSPWSRRGKR